MCAAPINKSGPAKKKTQVLSMDYNQNFGLIFTSLTNKQQSDFNKRYSLGHLANVFFSCIGPKFDVMKISLSFVLERIVDVSLKDVQLVYPIVDVELGKMMPFLAHQVMHNHVDMFDLHNSFVNVYLLQLYRVMFAAVKFKQFECVRILASIHSPTASNFQFSSNFNYNWFTRFERCFESLTKTFLLLTDGDHNDPKFGSKVYIRSPTFFRAFYPQTISQLEYFGFAEHSLVKTKNVQSIKQLLELSVNCVNVVNDLNTPVVFVNNETNVPLVFSAIDNDIFTHWAFSYKVIPPYVTKLTPYLYNEFMFDKPSTLCELSFKDQNQLTLYLSTVTSGRRDMELPEHVSNSIKMRNGVVLPDVHISLLDSCFFDSLVSVMTVCDQVSKLVVSNAPSIPQALTASIFNVVYSILLHGYMTESVDGCLPFMLNNYDIAKTVYDQQQFLLMHLVPATLVDVTFDQVKNKITSPNSSLQLAENSQNTMFFRLFVLLRQPEGHVVLHIKNQPKFNVKFAACVSAGNDLKKTCLYGEHAYACVDRELCVVTKIQPIFCHEVEAVFCGEDPLDLTVTLKENINIAKELANFALFADAPELFCVPFSVCCFTRKVQQLQHKLAVQTFFRNKYAEMAFVAVFPYFGPTLYHYLNHTLFPDPILGVFMLFMIFLNTKQRTKVFWHDMHLHNLTVKKIQSDGGCTLTYGKYKCTMQNNSTVIGVIDFADPHASQACRTSTALQIFFDTVFVFCTLHNRSNFNLVSKLNLEYKFYGHGICLPRSDIISRGTNQNIHPNGYEMVRLRKGVTFPSGLFESCAPYDVNEILNISDHNFIYSVRFSRTGPSDFNSEEFDSVAGFPKDTILPFHSQRIRDVWACMMVIMKRFLAACPTEDIAVENCFNEIVNDKDCFKYLQDTYNLCST